MKSAVQRHQSARLFVRLKLLLLTSGPSPRVQQGGENILKPPFVLQEDGTGLFRSRPLPQSLCRGGASEDATSDDERMVICEEEGDDDVMGKPGWASSEPGLFFVCFLLGSAGFNSPGGRELL